MSDGLPDPGEFHDRLLGLFGKDGALSLERTIVKDLATKLRWSTELPPVSGTFDFDAIIRAAAKRVSC
jgi:hypothetical protein